MNTTNVDIKQVICTITYQAKSSFTCDILMTQNQPPNPPEFGDFQRIKNHKILQIATNEGIWAHFFSAQMLWFNRKVSEGGVGFIYLEGVPSSFLDLVMFLGKEFTGTGFSTFDQQPLDWRIHQV